MSYLTIIGSLIIIQMVATAVTGDPHPFMICVSGCN